MSQDSTNEKSSEEAYAYTPGLKVKLIETVTKERRLPLPGEVLVKVGDRVAYDTVIARSEVPGDPYIVKASQMLGVEAEELQPYVIKKKGDKVKKGDILAQYVALFGMFKKFAYSPIDGIVETISQVSGQIVVRPPPTPIAVRAYIPGTISKIIPNEGAFVETKASYIQGIFGLGGETQGKIKICVKDADDVLTPELITQDDKGRILVGGSQVTLEAVKKAIQVEAAGIVVGGIDYADILEFTGEVIGVAITGQEQLGLTLIITEGIGKIAMSARTYDLLKKFEGSTVSMNGATQIRAGVIRPEIVKPLLEPAEEEKVLDLVGGMTVGTPVRIIRDPYFGFIGRVSALPVDLQKIATESSVRVLEVELEDGRRVLVPRANVEIIEE